MIYCLPFRNFLNILPAFPCESAIGNLSSISLETYILLPFLCVYFAIGIILVLKPLKTSFLLLRNLSVFLKVRTVSPFSFQFTVLFQLAILTLY